MTDDRIKQLRDLANAATPGPWVEHERCNNARPDEACGIASERTCCETIFRDRDCPRLQHVKVTIFASDAYDECSHPVSAADAAFIAAARSAVPELLDECERLRAALHEIGHDPHCSYDAHGPSSSDSDRQYKIGIADGHRCAANKARAALREEQG